MSTSPKISVLMPVFNCERFLHYSIDSLFKQSFADWELIVVNDGSTDSSLECLQRLARSDSRIVVLDQPNGGLGAALHAGQSMCTGQYVARMDGDDICTPDRLAKQFEFMENNPHIGACGAWAETICPNGIPIGNVVRPPQSHVDIRMQLLQGNGQAIVHPLLFVRRQILTSLGGYCRDCRVAEDVDLYLRLEKVTELANLPEILLQYRQHLKSSNMQFIDDMCNQHQALVNHYRRQEGLPEISWTAYKADPVICLHTWAQNAIKHRQCKVAIRYAVSALRMKPISRAGWLLLFKALGAYTGPSVKVNG